MDYDRDFKKDLDTTFAEKGVSEESAKEVVKRQYPHITPGQVEACTRHALHLHKTNGFKVT